MDKEKSKFFKNKAVLVTGGTGSIGSEIVRQVLKYKPKVVRIFSRDESKQFFLQQELQKFKNLRYLIGDIRDRSRLHRAMEGIDYVFHAAALKHVPACEYNPFESVQTNVIGTQNVIEAALDANVKRVIAISTDKAINPSNTMGATKLLAEKIMTSANRWITDTKLACVRFGNVLGSRGSLIPLVEHQVLNGNPVTLTHKQMTRFMMSVEDAVNLVLESAMITEGGDKFILKMKAMKVEDMIDVLIDHFTNKHKKDPKKIKKKVIGIRPGEKLDEELITEQEIGQTEELPHMFKILPYWKKVSKKPKIKRSDLVSSEARLLSKAEIKKLLKDSGVF